MPQKVPMHTILTRLAGSLILVIAFTFVTNWLSAQSAKPLSINGFTQWRTGHDEVTEQLVPTEGSDALVVRNGKTLAHVKFNVKGYGEVSFPIDPRTPEGEEARKVDLSKSEFVCITYKSTHDMILQLRQTGVHGGTHNRVSLPASKKFVTTKIYFSEFHGGKTPLDLSDVAKFNFAFLSRPDKLVYTAELVVSKVLIEGYKP
jgi:hypothetical protein